MSESPIRNRPPQRLHFSLATLLFLIACVAGFFAGFRFGYERGHQARVNEIPVSRMYDVADLNVDDSGSSSVEELITSQVSPESWDDVGGIGTINVVGDSLMIYQNVDVHERIEALLNQLRQPRRKVDP
jgi:hypothetical protein